MPAKAGIQAGRLRGCLVDSRFRGNDEFGTQPSSWAKPVTASSRPISTRDHELRLKGRNPSKSAICLCGSGPSRNTAGPTAL
jgi:hypothetical protein